MQIISHSITNIKIAEIISDEMVVGTASQGLDLLGTLYFDGYDALVLNQYQFNAEFFDLKNGMAGELFQKFSNYRMRLAIVGDFETIESKSLKDFILECNRGKRINFVKTREQAFSVLGI